MNIPSSRRNTGYRKLSPARHATASDPEGLAVALPRAGHAPQPPPVPVHYTARTKPYVPVSPPPSPRRHAIRAFLCRIDQDWSPHRAAHLLTRKSLHRISLAVPPLIFMKDSGRRISYPAIEFLLLRWNAEKLLGEFLKPAQAKVFRLTHPRLRVHLRIGERHHKLHIVPLQAVISLFQYHFVAMRVAKVIEPCPVVKAVRLHNEYIPLPVTDGVSQHSWIGILRKVAPIGPDFAMHVMPIEQLFSMNHTKPRCHDVQIIRETPTG